MRRNGCNKGIPTTASVAARQGGLEHGDRMLLTRFSPRGENRKRARAVQHLMVLFEVAGGHLGGGELQQLPAVGGLNAPVLFLPQVSARHGTTSPGTAFIQQVTAHCSSIRNS